MSFRQEKLGGIGILTGIYRRLQTFVHSKAIDIQHCNLYARHDFNFL